MRFLLVALGAAHSHSPHTERECECLARYARGKWRIVELGVDQAADTSILSAAMSRDGRLYAVDPYAVGRFGVSFPRLIARIQVSRVVGARVHWLRMTEAEAAPVLAELEPAGVELIFSDCVFDFESLACEWSRWRERLAPGGIFIQSTSRPFAGRTDEDHETVRFAREVLLREPDFDCVETIDTFTVLARRV